MPQWSDGKHCRRTHLIRGRHFWLPNIQRYKENLIAGDLLQADESEKFGDDVARMGRAYVDAVEAHPRLELARKLFVGVPQRIPRVLALLPRAANHPNVVNSGRKATQLIYLSTSSS